MRRGMRGVLLAFVLLVGIAPARAEEGGVGDAVRSYFDDWFARVDRAQASQPRWITPLATTTPRLEEEVRYDQYWQNLPNGGSIDTYGGGKGLELIPAERVELILGVPPYEERWHKNQKSGFGDWPFLLVKYRILSANRENGNYILTAFLQGVAPTGATGFTTHSYAIVPTIAGGKGWGDFDVQATLGVNIPVDRQNITAHFVSGNKTSTLGDSVLGNIAFQYNFMRYFWPEMEVNWTWFADGLRQGKNQVFITPGIVLGRFSLYRRLGLTIGAGYQIAVSPHQSAKGLLPAYRNSPILSVRFPF